MQRTILIALYAISVAAAILLTTTSPITITTAHHWSSLAMYLVVAPALAWLAIDFWLAKHTWFAAMFGALAAERLYLLAQIAGQEGHYSISPNGLVPIVLFLSIVLFRLAFGRLLARLVQYAHGKASTTLGPAARRA